jgi:catechol 2,3-dioxygenase-like lactoylglutathione lyase family enzyme
MIERTSLAASAQNPAMHMLHHISLGICNVGRSAAFYDHAFALLGYVRVWSDLRPGAQAQAVGYGSAGGGDKLSLKQIAHILRDPFAGFHVAFTAPTRESVVRFHAAALAAGGSDNGEPGLRQEYGPNYYAAFVIDADGYHLEAVCRSAA